MAWFLQEAEFPDSEQDGILPAWVGSAGLCSVNAQASTPAAASPAQGVHTGPLHPLLETLVETAWKSLQQRLQSEKFCFSACEALKLCPAEVFSNIVSVLPGAR